MKYHSTDLLIFLVALLGAVVVAVLEFKYAPGVDVSCFSSMGESEIQYEKNYCTLAWKIGDVYNHFFGTGKLDSTTSFRNLPKRKNQPEWKQKRDELERSGRSLIPFIMAQLALAAATFVTLQMVIHLFVARSLSGDLTEDSSVVEQTRRKKFLKRMAQSRKLTALYSIVLVIAACGWVVLGVLSHMALVDRSLSKSESVDCSKFNRKEQCDAAMYYDSNTNVDVFLCAYHIWERSIPRQTIVQCVATAPLTENARKSAEINTGLCYTIAGLLLVHLLYTLVVVPAVNREITAEEKRRFFICDIHLLLAVQPLS